MFPVLHEIFTQFILYNVLVYKFGLRLHWNRTCWSNSQRKQGEKKPEQCQDCHYTTNSIWWIYSIFRFLLPLQRLDEFHWNIQTDLFGDRCGFCE
jgi:hypothetical protein